MIWKGKEIRTNREFMNDGIDQCHSPEEAREFMKLYFEENPHAYSNIGYMAGYYDREKCERIWDWFQCAHPIFGTSQQCPEQLIKAGMAIAEERNATH